MKKARFLFLHPDANLGKIAALDDLQTAYTEYLKVCLADMLAAHRFKILRSEFQTFFPPCATLSSQIVKNVRSHAVGMFSGWAASKYTVKLRRLIKTKFKDGEFDETVRSALCILGKKLVDKPSGKVTQEAIDLYWSWLLDETVVGRTPNISNRVGMRMSEMTAVLGTSGQTKLTAWWLGFSHLEAGKARIQLPLVANPCVSSVNDVSKGILVRKTKQGRWRFEVVERKEWEIPEVTEDAPRIGVDVGLNVMVATSDGRLLGADLKPKFNALYDRVTTIRQNRQRQGLKENSPRLDALESKLSGMIKTCAGEAANKLIEAYPSAVFVIEDLDLRGCRGQKRFAYRAVHHALGSKAPCLAMNPAYSSQTCPSCGYVSRSNRSGVKFNCRSCGRISHADVVGAVNLLGRSVDKQVDLDDHPSTVKALFRERYRARRRDSSSRGLVQDRARTVEPEAYYRGDSIEHRHSLEFDHWRESECLILATSENGSEQLEQPRTEIERLEQLTLPSIPPDLKRLLFRVKSGGKTKGTPLLILDGQTYQLTAAIDRVKLGRRNDVELILSGDTLQGDIDATLEGFRRAGIELHIRDVRTPRVSGNARGQYGGVRGHRG